MLAFVPAVTVSAPHTPAVPRLASTSPASGSGEARCLALGVLGLLAVSRQRPARAARRQRGSKVEEPSHEDYDTLLMKAGLRNLLGVEENRMARKLEEACEVSTDLKRCLSDVEVKHKIAKDEVDELTTRLAAVQADNDSLRGELAELNEKVKASKEANEAIKAKNSEQWVAQKDAENERDKALLDLKKVKDEAEAAQIKAESQVKSAKKEIEALRAELKELQAKKKAVKA
ncbi:unnamed protein product [Effrenium voratum]|nr:unnamed protein product [Effrenium voratum]